MATHDIPSNIIGIGTDIVNIERLQPQTTSGVSKNASLQRIADFIFSTREKRDMKKSRSMAEFIASRWAAKEAVIKAYPGLLRPKDIEIVKKNKKPIVVFKRPHDKKFTAFLSISHDFDYALAYVILVVKQVRTEKRS